MTEPMTTAQEIYFLKQDINRIIARLDWLEKEWKDTHAEYREMALISIIQERTNIRRENEAKQNE